MFVGLLNLFVRGCLFVSMFNLCACILVCLSICVCGELPVRLYGVCVFVCVMVLVGV